MKLTLPICPSANHYKRHICTVDRTHRLTAYLVPAAKQFVVDVGTIAMIERIEPLGGPVAVTVDVYRARKSGDTEGFLKLALDALQGLAYHNDSQIVRIVANRHDDKHNPRIEVDIEEV